MECRANFAAVHRTQLFGAAHANVGPADEQRWALAFRPDCTAGTSTFACRGRCALSFPSLRFGTACRSCLSHFLLQNCTARTLKHSYIDLRSLHAKNKQRPVSRDISSARRSGDHPRRPRPGHAPSGSRVCSSLGERPTRPHSKSFSTRISYGRTLKGRPGSI